LLALAIALGAPAAPAEQSDPVQSEIKQELSALEGSGKSTGGGDPISSLAFKYSGPWIDAGSSTGQPPKVIPAAPPSAVGGDGGVIGEGGGNPKDPYAGNRTGLRIMPYGLHYCFFVDPSTSEDKVDRKVRLIVDRYATCGVAVQPHVFTMTGNYSRDPQQLGEQARAACPIGNRYGERGAVQVDVDSQTTAQQMCNDPGASGCSSLCERISFSVVGPGAPAGLGLHESGHSNCCGSFCVNAGEGTRPAGSGNLGLDLVTWREAPRETNRYWAAEGDNLGEGTFNDAACASIRAGASTNPDGYQDHRGQRRFYTRAEAGKRVDITRGESVLGEGPQPHNQMLGAAGGGGSGEGGGSEPFDINGAPSEEELRELTTVAGGGPIHPIAGDLPAVAASLVGTLLAGPGSASFGAGGIGATVGPQRIEYDEGIAKSAAVGASGGTGGTRTFGSLTGAMAPEVGMGADTIADGPPSDRSESRASRKIEMDEGAPKGAPGSYGNGRGDPLYANGVIDGAQAIGAINAGTSLVLGAKGVVASTKRKRGASLKRRHEFKVQGDDLISSRTVEDYSVDPNKDIE
jgi:hypothetical protein